MRLKLVVPISDIDAACIFSYGNACSWHDDSPLDVLAPIIQAVKNNSPHTARWSLCFSLEQVKAIADAHEIEKSKADALAEDLKLRAEEALNDKLAFERQNAEEKTANETRLQELQASGKASTREAVSRILKLFYFSRVNIPFLLTCNNCCTVKLKNSSCILHEPGHIQVHLLP